MPRGSCFSKSEIHISLSLNEAMNIAILAMVYMHPHHLSAWTRLQLSHTRRQQLNLWLVEYHIRKYHTIMSCLASSENQDGTRKSSPLKRKIIFQTFMFGFHVNFQGCFLSGPFYPELCSQVTKAHDIFAATGSEWLSPLWLQPSNLRG